MYYNIVTSSKSSWPIPICGLILLSVILMGCGSGEARGRIFGKVTFQGQAVSEGIVLFSNVEQGISMTSEIKPDGSYEVVTSKGDGLPVGGTYKVCVNPLPPVVVTGMPPPRIKPCLNIPLKYRNLKTARLTLTVQEGENPFDIEMKP